MTEDLKPLPCPIPACGKMPEWTPQDVGPRGYFACQNYGVHDWISPTGTQASMEEATAAWNALSVKPAPKEPKKVFGVTKADVLRAVENYDQIAARDGKHQPWTWAKYAVRSAVYRDFIARHFPDAEEEKP